MYRILLMLLLASASVSAQNASNYFPASIGYKWYFKNTPLDSLNNPVPSESSYQVDSFAAITNYQGLQASKVVTKSGLTSVNQNAPYIDTNHFNFQTTNSWYYLNVLSYLGSIPFIDSAAFVEFLRSFEEWYSTYRFAQTVNQNYTIFTRDTTVTFDTLTLPLRISATGRRLNDQTISTVNGSYLTKKFIITLGISYGLLPPFIYIPIVTIPDTVYLAENVWKVKETIPSVNIDFSSLGFEFAFSIPGVMRELTQSPLSISNHGGTIAKDYVLYQNYPNPFNPKTVIRFDVTQDASRETQDARLSIYNSAGVEVAELVNDKLHAGSYSIDWDASNFPSGIYYYKFSSDNFIDTKKMILLK